MAISTLPALILAWLIFVAQSNALRQFANEPAPLTTSISSLAEYDSVYTKIRLDSTSRPPPTRTTWGFHQLQVRADGVKPSQACVQTGVCMLEILNAGSGPESAFESTDAIEASGWLEYEAEPDNLWSDLDGMMKANKWSASDFEGYYIDRPQPWIPYAYNADRYWTAYYSMWINTKAGVLIATHSYAPQDPILRPRDPTDTTTTKGAPAPLDPAQIVRRWSDIAYLNYLSACEGNTDCMKRIEWVIRYDVRNPTTHQRIVEAAVNAGEGLSNWPGIKRQMVDGKMDEDDEGGNDGPALLGTPNGYGVAWLLANHPHSFGAKTIDYVHLWQAGNTRGASLAFHIAKKP